MGMVMGICELLLYKRVTITPESCDIQHSEISSIKEHERVSHFQLKLTLFEGMFFSLANVKTSCEKSIAVI